MARVPTCNDLRMIDFLITKIKLYDMYIEKYMDLEMLLAPEMILTVQVAMKKKKMIIAELFMLMKEFQFVPLSAVLIILKNNVSF